MRSFSVADAARMLGVSDDTVRRHLAKGRLTPAGGDGRRTVDGRSLARLARDMAGEGHPPRGAVVAESARNRFAGIVTRVERDRLTALVEIQAGPHQVTSLMTREAADDLGLEPGVPAIAAVKATNVVIEVPQR